MIYTTHVLWNTYFYKLIRENYTINSSKFYLIVICTGMNWKVHSIRYTVHQLRTLVVSQNTSWIKKNVQPPELMDWKFFPLYISFQGEVSSANPCLGAIPDTHLLFNTLNTIMVSSNCYSSAFLCKRPHLNTLIASYKLKNSRLQISEAIFHHYYTDGIKIKFCAKFSHHLSATINFATTWDRHPHLVRIAQCSLPSVVIQLTAEVNSLQIYPIGFPIAEHNLPTNLQN